MCPGLPEPSQLTPLDHRWETAKFWGQEGTPEKVQVQNYGDQRLCLSCVYSANMNRGYSGLPSGLVLGEGGGRTLPWVEGNAEL